MQYKIREIGRFVAKDAAGNSYPVVMKQKFIESPGRGGSTWLPGMKSMDTTNGRPVNYVSKGKYEIVDGFVGNIPIASDDPNAP